MVAVTAGEGADGTAVVLMLVAEAAVGATVFVSFVPVLTVIPPRGVSSRSAMAAPAPTVMRVAAASEPVMAQIFFFVFMFVVLFCQELFVLVQLGVPVWFRGFSP